MINFGIAIRRLSDNQWEYTVRKDGMIKRIGFLGSEREAFIFAVNYIVQDQGYGSEITCQ